MRSATKFATISIIAVVVTGTSLGRALADPPLLPPWPSLTDVVGVGADTSAGVMNAITRNYDGTNPANKLYSWDSTNPATGAGGDQIITKTSTPTVSPPTDTICQMARPASPDAGISALAAGTADGGHPCVDYAPSSRGPRLSDPGNLLWVAFARDATSWTVPGGSPAPASLTESQLQAIYSCTVRTWNQVGGSTSATIVPVLPQSGSGTTDFFLSAIGVGSPGSCVVNGSISIPGDPSNPVPVEPNTGTSPSSAGGSCSSADWTLCLTGNAFLFATNVNTIAPYSVADWIAQEPPPFGGGHGTAGWAPGILQQPRQVSGATPVVTHSGPPVTIDTINPSFSTSLTGIAWNVVPNAGTRVAPQIPANLNPVFGPTTQAPHGVCSDTADIQSYGFETIGASCGTVILPPVLGAQVAGVGADTTSGLMNALAGSINKTSKFDPPSGSSGPLLNWDAINPLTGQTGDTIITKSLSSSDRTCQITRPNGSGAGIRALAATVSDQGHPCIDYARSSRGTQTGDPTGLLWIAFAKDAVSWTTPGGGAAKPVTLTQSQLQGIYNCTITNWNLVGGGNGTIVPVLPQVSSGTRAFFLNAIGVTTPGPCVVNGSITIPGTTTAVLIEENSGVSPSSAGGDCSFANWTLCTTGNAYEFATFPNAIFPYSVGDWIAQEPGPAGDGHATNTSAPGVLGQPGQISGTSPVVTGTPDTINTKFSSTFTRIVWTVVKNAGTKTAPVIPPGDLTTLFGPASKGGYLCSNPALIQNWGFETIGASCGAFFQTS